MKIVPVRFCMLHKEVCVVFSKKFCITLKTESKSEKLLYGFADLMFECHFSEIL